MGQDSGARLGGCVLWEGGFSRDRKQQNAGFRRLRASFLHTTIINLRAEIKDPRAKEIIDSARKRFPGAAHGQPPPTAGKLRAALYRRIFHQSAHAQQNSAAGGFAPQAMMLFEDSCL
ncbi:uncharacterized protein LOC135302994 isoform X5 [Passer domesticus]|uniref:uncharacterized protein LOC135302994 isoform X5 n=1 Tax=Passer domesticus TaxID=48849 RepID=UPI0030FE77F2